MPASGARPITPILALTVGLRGLAEAAGAGFSAADAAGLTEAGAAEAGTAEAAGFAGAAAEDAGPAEAGFAGVVDAGAAAPPQPASNRAIMAHSCACLNTVPPRTLAVQHSNYLILGTEAG